MVMATKADSKNFWDLFSTLTVGKFLNKLKKKSLYKPSKNKAKWFPGNNHLKYLPYICCLCQDSTRAGKSTVEDGDIALPW